MKTEIDTPLLARVRALVMPIASDLGVDVYDLEMRGGTLRLTLDTPAGSPKGITLELLSLATRLVSKELDAQDPMPSRYTLEVTSPGVERSLRTPDHFHRELGKDITVRLHDVEADQRRVRGRIVAADELTVTLDVDGESRVVEYRQIDRAKTVFEWGGQPKPGGPKPAARPARASESPDRGAEEAPQLNDRGAEEAPQLSKERSS